MTSPVQATRRWKRLHGVLTVGWLAMLPTAIITGWIYAIAFVSAISIYANFAGEFSAWQACRAEEKIDKQNKESK